MLVVGMLGYMGSYNQLGFSINRSLSIIVLFKAPNRDRHDAGFAIGQIDLIIERWTWRRYGLFVFRLLTGFFCFFGPRSDLFFVSCLLTCVALGGATLNLGLGCGL